MEGADQVLALARIDTGLAADRRVDLRQKRCRYLHEIQPAPHAGRRESGEIADHAAAERDHQVVALNARGDDGLAHGFKGRIVFRTFAGRDKEMRRDDAGGGKNVLDRGEMMLPHRLVGQDHGLGIRPQRLDARAERSDHAAPDDDVIGALSQRHRHHDGFVRTDGLNPRRGHD